jgi:hypothetical protein
VGLFSLHKKTPQNAARPGQRIGEPQAVVAVNGKMDWTRPGPMKIARRCSSRVYICIEYLLSRLGKGWMMRRYADVAEVLRELSFRYAQRQAVVIEQGRGVRAAVDSSVPSRIILYSVVPCPK